MLPWSVIPIAGWPSATALATSSSSRAAPSSIENSVWTWRWVNESPTVIDSVGESHERDSRTYQSRRPRDPSATGRDLADRWPECGSADVRGTCRGGRAWAAGICAGATGRRVAAGASARAAGGRRAAGRTAWPGCRGTGPRASRRAAPWRCAARPRSGRRRRRTAGPAMRSSSCRSGDSASDELDDRALVDLGQALAAGARRAAPCAPPRAAA